MLSVPFTFPGAMVQLSVFAFPAATTTVICTCRALPYCNGGEQSSDCPCQHGQVDV